MPFTFDESRLKQAIQLEDASGCDIQAGLNVGINADAYIASAESYITHEKVMAVLQAELGTLLSQEDLEFIACSTQQAVHERLAERFQTAKSA